MTNNTALDLSTRIPRSRSGLPTVAPYPLPGKAELPDNRVDWAIDPAKAVLLVHDMQNYFLNVFTPATSPVQPLIANIAVLKTWAARHGVPVVYTAQPGSQDPAERALLTDFWGPGLPDEEGQTSIVAALAPGADDTVMTKWRYSAFQRTELAAFLAEHGRSQLVISGIYAHIGCLLTAAEAFMKDIQAFVVADAVADFSAADHQRALEYAAKRCGRVVLMEEFGCGQPQAPASVSIEDVRRQIAAAIGEEPSDIADGDDLLEWGMDSIRIMALVESWRTRGFPVTFADLAESMTVAGWHQALHDARRAGSAT